MTAAVGDVDRDDEVVAGGSSRGLCHLSTVL